MTGSLGLEDAEHPERERARRDAHVAIMIDFLGGGGKTFTLFHVKNLLFLLMIALHTV